MKHKCLFCYSDLDSGNHGYHQRCSKAFFGKKDPPDLSYSLDEIQELAKKVVRSSVTVPGVQAKISLGIMKHKSESHKCTLVGLWGDYILKPPIPKYPHMPEVEDVTMHLAELFTITTVPHSLIRFKSGELAYITKRVDRRKNKNKVHMEDLCQLSERLTEDKYKGSMEKVGTTIITFSSNPIFDVISFFEVTLFSFLTGNADMHLKNFSLIHHDNGMIGLSPAYDLLSTRLLIPEKYDNEEMALPIQGKKRNFKKIDFIQFGTHIQLHNKQIENILRKFAQKLPLCNTIIDQSFLPNHLKEDYKDLIAKRAKRIGFM